MSDKFKLLAIVILIGLGGYIAPAKAGPLVATAEKIEEVTPRIIEWVKDKVIPLIQKTGEEARRASIKALEKTGE